MNAEQIIQSWHEPALNTLGSLLSVRKANLRKINRPESNAMVLQQEFIESLMDFHRISLWLASEIVASLIRAKRVAKYGRFLQIKNEGGKQ
ncbi:hypothetical protein ACFODO_20760 [Acinetobacter sichuanensis]|uniref:Uncharacterized protein n=1 Tax=Acinetobacter sichuanensis TaxID=2136183 RepID=A0A371YIF8_9GAMM|nr:hypothetical protein [Acinetobacter sichuanensis]RFC81257.1 hypothetical protein C9E89_022850 [Acinetobacter sichuanensis]